MTETYLSTSPDSDIARRGAFRPVLILLTAFLVVCVAMLAVLVVLSATGVGVDIAVWIRCSLVFGSAVILLLFGAGAARGSRNAWVRLRIVSPIIVVAVIVIVSIPGFLPDWVRVEQAACGALVLPVAIIANLPRTRALFSRER
jgi:hypothetical protein